MFNFQVSRFNTSNKNYTKTKKRKKRVWLQRKCEGKKEGKLQGRGREGKGAKGEIETETCRAGEDRTFVFSIVLLKFGQEFALQMKACAVEDTTCLPPFFFSFPFFPVVLASGYEVQTTCLGLDPFLFGWVTLYPNTKFLGLIQSNRLYLILFLFQKKSRKNYRYDLIIKIQNF